MNMPNQSDPIPNTNVMPIDGYESVTDGVALSVIEGHSDVVIVSLTGKWSLEQLTEALSEVEVQASNYLMIDSSKEEKKDLTGLFQAIIKIPKTLAGKQLIFYGQEGASLMFLNNFKIWIKRATGKDPVISKSFDFAMAAFLKLKEKSQSEG